MTPMDSMWVKGLQDRIEQLETMLLHQAQENIGLCAEVSELKRRLSEYEQTDKEKDSQAETE